jgi:hypothetical protein
MGVAVLGVVGTNRRVLISSSKVKQSRQLLNQALADMLSGITPTGSTSYGHSQNPLKDIIDIMTNNTMEAAIKSIISTPNQHSHGAPIYPLIDHASSSHFPPLDHRY